MGSKLEKLNKNNIWSCTEGRQENLTMKAGKWCSICGGTN